MGRGHSRNSGCWGAHMPLCLEEAQQMGKGQVGLGPKMQWEAPWKALGIWGAEEKR